MQWTRAIAALRQRWWVVVLAGFLGLCGGLGVAAALPVRYESTATVFISLDSGSSATEFNAGSTFALNLVASYAEVATMPVVLRPVVVELDLDVTPAELAGQVEVQVPANTSLLDIVVTDLSPDTAAAIANAIAARLPGAVSTLSPAPRPGAPPCASPPQPRRWPPPDPARPPTPWWWPGRSPWRSCSASS